MVYYYTSGHERYTKFSTVIMKRLSKISYNLKQLLIYIEKPNVRKCIIGVLNKPRTADTANTVNELSISMDYTSIHFFRGKVEMKTKLSGIYYAAQHYKIIFYMNNSNVNNSIVLY